MLDYKLLEAYVKVIEEGGFEKAAKKLHLTQSAVSQRVKQLEEQFEQILLIRSSPPHPTNAGSSLMNHYKNVFHLESDLNHLLHSTTKETFTSLSIGINADSLSIWFLDAMHEYLAESLVVLDLHVDDQEETHQLFKNGKVQAYIGTQKNTHYGVITEYLGLMNYYLVCTEEFYKKWFKKGFTYESSRRAPAVLYNNKDTLHQKQLKKAFQKEPADAPTFFIPSTEKFSDLILNHHAYGMLPWLQSQLLLQQGKLIKLLPESPIPVDLYLHSWSLKSKELDQFCTTLIKKAKTILMKH